MGTPRKTQRTHRTRGERSAGARVSLLLLGVVSLIAFVSFVPHLNAARSGTIRGRVELRTPTSPTERRPGVAEFGSPAPRDLPNLLRSVVYLESAPRGAF